MPGIDFTTVRQRITMAEVLGRLGFQPTSVRGEALRGPCPVHRSASPGSRSFSVHRGLGRYRCFRCGSRGNALELWAAAHRLSLYEAAVTLCQAVGVEVPWITRW
ncbi:MAG: CHC2 zinc finger domain-containing protein [Thermoguttaceae bacterium]|jgi:DNA primase